MLHDRYANVLVTLRDDPSLEGNRTIRNALDAAISVLRDLGSVIKFPDATERSGRGLLPPAVRDVLIERCHQVKIGYDAAHDDEHINDEIAAVAAFYIMPPAVRDWPAAETGYGSTFGEAIIPEGWHADGHQSRRQQLVMGVAMGLAEIERIDRATGESNG